MRNKTKGKKEYPLKRILITLGVVFVVCSTLGSISQSMIWDDFRAKDPPTSKHEKTEKAFKDETVYVYTDENGKPQSTVVDAYLKNNKEKNYLIDKSNLTGIKNVVQKDNEPEELKSGELRWNTDGNDVSYEGDGRTDNLPVSVEVRYFLNGREIPNLSARGASGHLRIELKFKSNERAVVEGKPAKVPYLALCSSTFGDDFKDINVSSGSVMTTGNTSIVVCTAMPGASSILGTDVRNGISDTVIITGKANKLEKNAFTVALNGDILTLLDNDTLSKINLDKAVDKMDMLMKKILAVSRKTVAVMEVVDKQVMPKVKATTHATSKEADKLAKNSPEVLKELEQTAGSIAAKIDVTLYVIHEIKEIVAPNEEVPATGNDSVSEQAEVVNEYLNGHTDENGEYVPGLADEMIENIEAEKEALESMDPDDPGYEVLAESVNSQIDIVEDLVGTESEEGICAVAEETAAEAQTADDKLEKINEMLSSGEWLEEEINNGNLEAYLGPERTELLKKYQNEIKDSEGNISAVLDISETIPYKTGTLYTTVEKLLSPKNQQSVVNVTKKIASGVRTVDKVVGKLGGIVGKISNGTKKVSNKMAQVYGEYIVDIINSYNSNIRGATGRIKLLKEAQEQAKVYSGLDKSMDGTSTYMFSIPIGTDSFNISNIL